MARRRSNRRRRPLRRPRRRQRRNLSSLIPSQVSRNLQTFRGWVTRTFIAFPLLSSYSFEFDDNGAKSWLERLKWWLSLGLKIVTVVLAASVEEDATDSAPVGAIGLYPMGVADLIADDNSCFSSLDTAVNNFRWTGFKRGRIISVRVQITTQTDVSTTGGFITACILPVETVADDTAKGISDNSLDAYKGFTPISLAQNPGAVRRRYGQTIVLNWRPATHNYMARQYSDFNNNFAATAMSGDGGFANPAPQFILAVGYEDVSNDVFTSPSSFKPSHAVMTICVSADVELEYSSTRSMLGTIIYNSKPSELLVVNGSRVMNVDVSNVTICNNGVFRVNHSSLTPDQLEFFRPVERDYVMPSPV